MKTKLPKHLNDRFLFFIEVHPIREFNSSLRRMLLDYIAQGINGGMHIHFDRFIVAINDLFELLDEMEEHKTKIEKVLPA